MSSRSQRRNRRSGLRQVSLAVWLILGGLLGVGATWPSPTSEPVSAQLGAEDTDVTSDPSTLPLADPTAPAANSEGEEGKEPSMESTPVEAVRPNLIAPDGLKPTAAWRASLEESGVELPGGGFDVFPGRRLVANYGAPVTTSLGVLGEMTLDENLADLQAKAEQYRASMPPGTDSPPIVPALEIIVSVATQAASPDNDYSHFINQDIVREWVDEASSKDMFVLLDLQPGRTDFLTQAKELDEFLRLPNVGLALDPEWRLKPDQVHLRQIGSVSANEVNEVADYLVDIVREENLPQKILLLHQFKTSMIPDRQLVRTPQELAVVVHADGQGALPTKYATWDQLLTFDTPPEQTLWWGWKNFYDEDFPRATPAEVNLVEPLPVLVTYQ